MRAVVIAILALTGTVVAAQPATTPTATAPTATAPTATAPAEPAPTTAGTPPPTLTAAPEVRTTTASTDDPFFQFYATNLRGSLFSGCLTLGSFLLAVNTFIVVNLKKEVYEHKNYRKIVRETRKRNPKVTFYGPLNRLSGFLIWTISFALIAAVSQITLGILVRRWWAATACLSLVGIAIFLLFATLFLIRQNLRDWFKFLEEQANEEEQAATTPAVS